MSGLVSDEIAEDYKSSLEDLTSNDGIQIRTLTVIAKENTEHAMAISRVLENHIRSTPPQQKLPALYVADSIAKNVGSPYTLFLGRNMYQTFMNVYTLVDSNTRRKLDEMLNTWKQPAPGSLDTRPVFPPDITRNIESALIKARTAALQHQQARPQPEINRGRANGTPTGWSSTTHGARNQQNPYPGHSTSTPPPNQRQDIDLHHLNRDVDGLIAAAKIDFANSPFNPACQQRLKALVDLQAILQRQQLSQDQLQLVRNQVSQLAASRPPSAAPNPVASAQVVPQMSTPPAQSAQLAQPVSQPLQQLLNPGTLAELIKATASRQQPTPPPAMPLPLPQMPQIPQQSSTPQPENPLIAALRARGLLPSGPAPPSLTPSASSTPVPGTATLPYFMSNGAHPPQSLNQAANTSGVPMTTASMKIPRFGLVVSLYDSRPNRCGTCGRRFFATEKGKEMKARHLDWHFKTNQRMTESSRRAQNRSWYVDERDWIKSREAGDENGATDPQATAEGAAGDESAKQEPSKPWIRAPNDATLRNTPCPICQEKFESTWSEDVQDWIWQDATKVGPRVYHASCYAEVTKGPAPARQTRTSTPDSVLGKRKAEPPAGSPKVRSIYMSKQTSIDSSAFTKDLLIDPSVRDASDVAHQIVAVASSSSKAKAEQFIAARGINTACSAYGDYEALVADPNVDVIYVATPHSHHYQNVRLALEAGKHVLCEKAFTVNAAQTKILIDIARKKNLFLMEAVWTRYFPLSIQIRELIQRGEIGEVLRVLADTSFGDDVEEKWGTTHRMVNPDLAGGALLDLGIYSLTWVFQTLYHTLPKEQRKPPTISSQMTPYHLTGADESTTVLLNFPTSTPSNGPHPHQSHGVAMTNIRVSADPDEKGSSGPSIRIQGVKGEIQVYGPPFRPERYRIIPKKGAGEIREVQGSFPGKGHGMYWEADEVARCLRDGKLESEGMPWEESIVIMEVMDEVRKQGGLTYPQQIESTDYPLQL
ncbi:unnamed protein product [Penicillium olsonii]|nr:unnamed protein product [Penicillium olsonii]CAG7927114.1 unnamed protein product [Penicillium olsonii]